MNPKVRLVGDRCPHQVGNSYLIAVSESEKLKVTIYEVNRETGAALCQSDDGRKFRAYAYGWSEETISRLGRTTVPLRWDTEIIVYKDQGFEVMDFHRVEGGVGSR